MVFSESNSLCSKISLLALVDRFWLTNTAYLIIKQNALASFSSSNPRSHRPNCIIIVFGGMNCSNNYFRINKLQWDLNSDCCTHLTATTTMAATVAILSCFTAFKMFFISRHSDKGVLHKKCST